jgi:hypothetical protein
MKAHGFTIEQLVELVRAGLATATPQHRRRAEGTGEGQGMRPNRLLDNAEHWRECAGPHKPPRGRTKHWIVPAIMNR